MRALIAVAAALALCLAAGASAQTYTVLHEFTGETTDGGYPEGGVVSDGARLYGVTRDGGADDYGALYSMNLDGSGFTLLHSFGLGGGGGEQPNGGLAIDNGVLYGTTDLGGTLNAGSLYSLNADGTGYTVLQSFAPGFWGSATPSPVAVSGGTVYGLLGAPYAGPPPIEGTLYSIRTDGTGYTVLSTFTGSPLDGSLPWGKMLLEDGILYGATLEGGKYYTEAGTLFSMPAGGGARTNLHEFSGSDGARPMGGLVSDGSRLYGMSGAGGFYYGLVTGGTVFAVDKNGANFQTLHTFDSGVTVSSAAKSMPIGLLSNAGLAMDGTRLYGTTFTVGGAVMTGLPIGGLDPGAIFALNTDGTGYTTLYTFDGVIEGTGSFPTGTMLLSNGTLYGATLAGGPEDMGVVYSYAVPPVPVDLTPNKTTFFSTDYIAVRANVSVITTPCLIFVRVVMPNGQTLYYEQGTGFVDYPTPYLGFSGTTTVPAPIWDYPVFDAQFRGMQTGVYYLEGGAIDAAQTTDINNPVYVGTVDREMLIVQ